MSTLLMFGANLRQLTQLRGPQSVVAEELDIGRVQFQRYLRSESFPKPNVLKRICDYFGVDARILTDPLTEEQLEQIRQGEAIADTLAQIAPDMREAVTFACPDQDFFQPGSELPDGIYQLWRGSMSRPGNAYMTLIQIKTLRRARVMRGFDHRSLIEPGSVIIGRQREFRGVLLRSQLGYVGLYFHSEPSRYVTMTFLSPFELNYQPAAVGFNCLARGPMHNHSRITRSIILRIDDTCGARLRAARQSGSVAWEDVPKTLLPYITPQDEAF